MNKFGKALVGLFILVGAANTSQAADVNSDIGNYDWSGVYVGLQGGYGFGQSEHYTTLTPASTGTFDIDGMTGGATVGANLQANNFVFGLEGDVSVSDINGTGHTSASWTCTPGCETHLYWWGTARARLGISFEHTLPYITGGVAVGEGEGKIPGAGAGYNAGKDTLVGWTAGGGIERAFTPNLSGKVEYLYTDLGAADLIDFGGGFGRGKADVNFSTVRVGLNWKF